MFLMHFRANNKLTNQVQWPCVIYFLPPAHRFYSELSEQDVAARRLMDKSRAGTAENTNPQGTAASLQLASHPTSYLSIYPSILPSVQQPLILSVYPSMQPINQSLVHPFMQPLI
jgi:hypothetical protein